MGESTGGCSSRSGHIADVAAATSWSRLEGGSVVVLAIVILGDCVVLFAAYRFAPDLLFGVVLTLEHVLILLTPMLPFVSCSDDEDRYNVSDVPPALATSSPGFLPSSSDLQLCPTVVER